ncbi:MAG: ACP S-malonyltransferase [Actinobacteria bacterium]|nr:ACP S-malonyltransferase [Actinomycetota bacterium]
MTIAWVFPGQGVQHRGMGGQLFDRYPTLCQQADEILGYSVREQCLAGAPPGLTDTRDVQPALFVVTALGWLDRRELTAAPDYLAGHSLGEYTALFAAGCFDFATGVRLVQRRGELMSAARGGGMLAVVDIEPRQSTLLHELLERQHAAGVDVANHNCASQLVLAGPAAALDLVAEEVRRAGLGRCVPLRVSAPFHSRHMAGAAAQFRDFLDGVALTGPRIPVIANVTGLPYPRDGVRELLVRQVDGPVRWWQGMSHLLELGVTELVEVGPGRVLTELWERVRQQPAPPAGPPASPAGPVAAGPIHPESLGCARFRRDYGLRYAYLSGSMFRGIASVELVVRMARAGLLGFFGAGGLSLAEIASALTRLRAALGSPDRFGTNLLATPGDPDHERALVDLYLEHDVRVVEAAGYTQVTPELVRFRFTGAGRGPDGTAVTGRRIVAKVSRPEVAEAFMSPPPRAMLDRLVAGRGLTSAEAAAADLLPIAGDVCVEADSAGHTDAGNPYALLPAMRRLRDELQARWRFADPIRVGAAGGLGSPEAVAAAFLLGADFVVTGSVNQCSPEAGTSVAVKDLLAGLDVQDTGYAPAGDLFEVGARVQVVRKGTLFAARANKLYQLYRQLDGLGELDPRTRQAIEERYFERSLDQVWHQVQEPRSARHSREVDRARHNPKAKMALVFRWYFAHTTQLALAGAPGEQVNYQIHCGPAMGAFNRVVAGTVLEPWPSRHVDAIAELLMSGAAEVLQRSLSCWTGRQAPPTHDRAGG